MTAASPVPHQRVTTPKVRVFAGNGAFLLRATAEQVDKLIAAGLAEWRGRDLRMVAMDGRRGLDGLQVTRRETAENARGCFSYVTRRMPGGGERVA